MGRWRYSLQTDKLTATMQIADHVYSLAREQNDSALMIGAYNALSGTLYFLGDFEAVHQYAMRGVQISRSESVQSQVQEVSASAVSVLCYEAQAKWHLGETASSQTTVAEAISLAKSMNDMPGLAVALWHAAGFAYYEGNPAEVERLASDLIELYTSKFCALAASRRGSPRLGAQHLRRYL